MNTYFVSFIQTCTALFLSADYTEFSCSSNIVIFDNFLVFNFPIFQFRTIISSSLDTSSSIFDVVTNRLNAFKIPRIAYYNHMSLMISGNDAKYIHLFPIFCTFQRSSYCKHKPFINSLQSYLFHYKFWLSFFSEIE